MKKLFLLFAVAITAITAMAQEEFYVTDEQGFEYLYTVLDTDDEVSLTYNFKWTWTDTPMCPEKVTIPATVTYEGKEYKVTEIGTDALCFEKITSVTLSEGLKIIAPRAFYRSSITELIVPESVDSIGGGLFGSGAFADCSKLEKIQLPKGLRSIAMFVFGNCTSLAEITIPAGVTSIYSSAFSGCSSLKSIEIPDAVTFIGEGAFYNCTSLESVKMPAKIDELGSNGYDTFGTGIFQGCSSLNNITLPEEIKTIPYNSFYGCTSLTSIKLPGELKEIGYSAFSGCTALDIEIPATVERIGGQAFWNTAMKNVVLPTGLLEINKNSFGDALENLFIDSANPYYTTIDGVLYNKDITELIIYPGNHGDSYTIPATVTTIDVATLSNVSHISVAPGNANFSCSDGALYNKDQTSLLLYTTDAPKSFVTPATVKVISANAFKNKPVESVVLNEGLESIEAAAFDGSTISNVTFPSTIVEIGNNAFYNCKLTEVNIPSSIDRIDTSAFGSNPDLITITIGETETRQTAHTIIEYTAFYNCENVKTITLGTCVKEVGAYAFLMSSPTKIVLSEGLESIGSNAFGKYGDYEYPTMDFSLPSTLKSIGNEAFLRISFPRVTCYAVTPPELPSYGNFPIYGDTLVIYDVAEQDYKTSRWVRLFTNIETMETSGIDTIEAENPSVRIPDIYYDLNGRRVTYPTNGIYIKNGKKVYLNR